MTLTKSNRLIGVIGTAIALITCNAYAQTAPAPMGRIECKDTARATDPSSPINAATEGNRVGINDYATGTIFGGLYRPYGAPAGEIVPLFAGVPAAVISGERTPYLMDYRVEGAIIYLTFGYHMRVAGADTRQDRNGLDAFYIKMPSPGVFRLVFRLPFGCTKVDTGAYRSFTSEGAHPTIIVDSIAHTPTRRYYLKPSSRTPESLVPVELPAYQEGTVDRLELEDSFRAWSLTESEAPANTVPVCRFYHAPSASYFYTAVAAECAALKTVPAVFRDDGVAFRTIAPVGGQCAAGTEPIYRLFNAALVNHRYTRSAGTYSTLQLNGWSGEGVAFCSPVG